VQINFRGPLEMRESLNALAARQRRTMSDFLRLQMEDLIKRSKRASVA
jgi:predicted DNA-binding protein